MGILLHHFLTCPVIFGTVWFLNFYLSHFLLNEKEIKTNVAKFQKLLVSSIRSIKAIPMMMVISLAWPRWTDQIPFWEVWQGGLWGSMFAFLISIFCSAEERTSPLFFFFTNGLSKVRMALKKTQYMKRWNQDAIFFLA